MPSTSGSTSPSSSPQSAFLDTFMVFGLEIKPSFQAIFEAQEEHCWSLEEWQEEIMWQWMEKMWEEQMSERELIAVVVNTQSARMVAEKAVVEIRKQGYSVSIGFLPFSIWI